MTCRPVTTISLQPACILPVQPVTSPNVNAEDKATPTQILQPGSTVATALSEGELCLSSLAALHSIWSTPTLCATPSASQVWLSSRVSLYVVFFNETYMLALGAEHLLCATLT